ncbi:MAG TPA: hypothetical protein VLB80_04940 [Candidatus Babeliales bacterium]|nr:hypothetical protein [Candidatus Babeliales bacterium]
MFIYLFLISVIIASTDMPSIPDELTELHTCVLLDAQEEHSLVLQECEAHDEITNMLVPMSEELVEASHIPKITDDSSLAESITIINAIDADMLAYKHWTGTYSPEIFTIAVDGTEIVQGSQLTLPSQTTTITIQYTYSFMNGMRSGTKKISYQLHENITRAQITFSWKDAWKVLLDNGTALKEITT